MRTFLADAQRFLRSDTPRRTGEIQQGRRHSHEYYPPARTAVESWA